jgi:hypothetical protein
MFQKAFTATLGVLVALWVWSIVTGSVAIIAIKLLEK